MLSRVAERVYWMARYLERVENTARLINVHHALLLDLPSEANIGWGPLLDILGCREAFDSSAANSDSDSVQGFIAADMANPSSLLSSLQQARENARTTRELVPTEGWRAVNQLHLYAREKLPRESAQNRHDVLTGIISRCQGISGLLAGTMSQGVAYQFIRVGRNLERADMTTRLIDVAAAVLLSDRGELRRYNNTLWMAILRSMSAYQMYRQHVRRRVLGSDVIEYLLKNSEFPRAVVHCLGEVETSLRKLPKPEAALERTGSVIAKLRGVDTSSLDIGGMHELIDELQLDVGAVHTAIQRTWFLPEEAAA
jgi:uncharacterized alpha-E superfamily protein